MENISKILVQFRLHFDEKEGHSLTNHEKSQYAKLLVEALLASSDDSLSKNLQNSVDVLIKLHEDDSRDVQQGSSDALNRLTLCLPETLLPRLRYMLFKDLQRTVNQPRDKWTTATYRRLKTLLARFSNLASSIKPRP